MKSFTSDGIEIHVPNISVISTDQTPRFKIDEGEHVGIEFSITNIRMDEHDESLMWYDLDTIPADKVDQVKPIVDNFILMILYEQIERSKTDGASTSNT